METIFSTKEETIYSRFHSTFHSSGVYNRHHGGGVLHSLHQSPQIHETEPATSTTSTQPHPHLPSGDSGASVNSDYSSGGASCSTAGGDRSPPYLPRNPSRVSTEHSTRVMQLSSCHRKFVLGCVNSAAVTYDKNLFGQLILLLIALLYPTISNHHAQN